MNAFLYARKSTDDKTHQVLSIETQLYELRQLAAKMGITIVREITEERTARVPGRKEFNRMLKDILAGEADAILCWKLHRLARNFDDGGKVITLVQTGSIKHIYTLEKTYSPQDNVLLLAIEFGIATQFSKDLSKDVKLGLQAKFRRGDWPSTAPLGYLNDKANKTVILNPPQAQLITQAFELAATGKYSIREIWAKMKEAGLRSRQRTDRSPSEMHHILRNPFYYGMMCYTGEYRQGNHEPLISKELFDRVQNVLADRHKPRTRALKNFTYRGVFRCYSCRYLITIESQKGHTYLRCTKRGALPCSEPYLREEKVHSKIHAYISTLNVPRSLPAVLAEVSSSMRNEVDRKQKQEVTNVQTELKNIEITLDNLLTLFLRNGITEEEYIQRKNRLVRQQFDLRHAMEHLQHPENRFEPVETLIRELNEAISLASGGSNDTRRDFLKKIGSNLFLSFGELCVDLKNRWKIYMEWQKGLPSSFEKIPVGYQRALVCSLLDKVRTAE